MPDTRSIWLVTHNGTPVGWKWALVRTPAEVDHSALPQETRAPGITDQQRVRWAAALNEAQAADPAYDATPTQWRRVPRVARAGLLEHGNPRVVGREVVVHGVKLRLDDRGRPHPASAPGRVHEPLEPDAEVVDEAALVAAAERAGGPIDLVERGTLRRVRVLHDAQAEAPAGVDAIRRRAADGAAVRVRVRG